MYLQVSFITLDLFVPKDSYTIVPELCCDGDYAVEFHSHLTQIPGLHTTQKNI